MCPRKNTSPAGVPNQRRKIAGQNDGSSTEASVPTASSNTAGNDAVQAQAVPTPVVDNATQDKSGSSVPSAVDQARVPAPEGQPSSEVSHTDVSTRTTPSKYDSSAPLCLVLVANN